MHRTTHQVVVVAVCFYYYYFYYHDNVGRRGKLSPHPMRGISRRLGFFRCPCLSGEKMSRPFFTHRSLRKANRGTIVSGFVSACSAADNNDSRNSSNNHPSRRAASRQWRNSGEPAAELPDQQQRQQADSRERNIN
jgi:hypothetical protein